MLAVAGRCRAPRLGRCSMPCVAHELEGVVAKRRAGSVPADDRGWVKVKNPEYWRYEMECEGAIMAAKRRQRAFV
jgi:hypothetical protein